MYWCEDKGIEGVDNKQRQECGGAQHEQTHNPVRLLIFGANLLVGDQSQNLIFCMSENMEELGADPSRCGRRQANMLVGVTSSREDWNAAVSAER